MIGKTTDVFFDFLLGTKCRWAVMLAAFWLVGLANIFGFI